MPYQPTLRITLGLFAPLATREDAERIIDWVGRLQICKSWRYQKNMVWKLLVKGTSWVEDAVAPITYEHHVHHQPGAKTECATGGRALIERIDRAFRPTCATPYLVCAEPADSRPFAVQLANDHRGGCNRLWAVLTPEVCPGPMGLEHLIDWAEQNDQPVGWSLPGWPYGVGVGPCQSVKGLTESPDFLEVPHA